MIKKIIFIIMIIICFIGICYGSYKVFTWKKDNDESNAIKEEINDYIIIDDTKEELKYTIDFSSL